METRKLLLLFIRIVNERYKVSVAKVQGDDKKASFTKLLSNYQIELCVGERTLTKVKMIDFHWIALQGNLVIKH